MLLSIIGGVALLFTVARTLETTQLISTLMGVGILIAAILSVVGRLFCLATPEESGAQGMIYASAAAMGITVAMWIGICIGLVPRGILAVQCIANFVAGITFLVFLRRLGLFIGRRDLADKARSILIWCGILFALFVAGIAMMTASAGLTAVQAFGRGNAQAAGGVGAAFGIGSLLIVVVLIAGLITFLRYANLLAYLRKAILSSGGG